MDRKNSDEKEIHQLRNRLHDLAEKSFNQGIFTFTGFLGLSEQDVFWQEEGRLSYAGYCLEGGYETADRVVLRFGNQEELGYETPFPIVCIHIEPLARKFADELSHRDFLGALMNLGIERSTVGDIKVGVKHTHVKCSIVESPANLPGEEPVPGVVQVQSLRADAVLAKVYNLSREKSLELFRAGKVYVNGRLCENNSRQLKSGETVNARGYGKFVLTGEPRETRKGKLAAEVAVYL